MYNIIIISLVYILKVYLSLKKYLFDIYNNPNKNINLNKISI